MAKKLEVPKEAAGDWLHALARGGLGSIPAVGSVVVEIFGQLLGPPIARRRDQFMEDVASEIKRLETERGVSLGELQKNETFLDTVLQATQAAVRTQSELKRTCLKNAIINAAMRSAPSAAMQHMFINFVNDFTDWHILLLELFHGPEQWAKNHDTKFSEIMSGAAWHLVEQAYPELTSQKELANQIWRDLRSAGLVTTDSLGGTMTWNGILSKRTADLGDRFLAFLRASNDAADPQRR